MSEPEWTAKIDPIGDNQWIVTSPEGRVVTVAGPNNEAAAILRAQGVIAPATPSPQQLLSAAQDKATLFASQIILKVEDSIMSQYSPGEIASWDGKRAEAAAVLAGELDPTKFPVIAAECAVTGETHSDLAASVALKANYFAAVAGTLAGKRKQWAAIIEAATDPDELKSTMEGWADELATALPSV